MCEVKSERRLSLRERNRQRLTQRIVDAAAELFRTVGYEQTTMDAIAERAEVSRGTLFNYFATKQSLLLPFAYELYKQKVQPEVRSYLDTSPTTLEALRAFFLSIYEHVFAFPGMEGALQGELFHSQTAVKHQRYGAGFIDMLSAILQYGQRRDEVRADISLEQLARYVGVLYIALMHNVVPPEEYIVEIDRLLAFLRPALAP